METVHDIWLGDAVDLCAILPSGSVNCVITDPPFGIDAISNQSVTEKGKEYARKIANDSDPQVAIEVFNKVMDSLLPKTSDDCDLYIFTSWHVLDHWIGVAHDLSRHGFTYKNMLIWEKNGASMGDTNSWGTSYEVILFLKKGKRIRTDKRRPGVIRVGQLPANTLIHPHEKPVELLQILLRHSSSEGDLVVDPFGGSGSLVRAAKEIGRNAIAMELDENNWKKAVRKLQDDVGLFS
ncbi:DNA methylase [Rhodococcus phage ReqiDocB7]|uniref:DNA methyltransferase n=1 Tax=Rhodococcus phage ReqiDocB7 TaxID=691966 RepID=UPI0001CDD766|nr:DNA methyltransferase [Rhodococcus phage ReqiDocB7]ADD80822.1 DNA methylase [Rhodococcus phage ReqiDocB7]